MADHGHFRRARASNWRIPAHALGLCIIMALRASGVSAEDGSRPTSERSLHGRVAFRGLSERESRETRVLVRVEAASTSDAPSGLEWSQSVDVGPGGEFEVDRIPTQVSRLELDVDVDSPADTCMVESQFVSPGDRSVVVDIVRARVVHGVVDLDLRSSHGASDSDRKNTRVSACWERRGSSDVGSAVAEVDSRGRFSIGAIPFDKAACLALSPTDARRASLRAYAVEVAPEVESVRVVARGDRAVTGQLVDVDGQAYSPALVDFRPTSEFLDLAAGGGAAALADAQGKFEIGHLEPGRYVVSVYGNVERGGPGLSVPVACVELEIDPRPGRSVQIRCEDRRPASTEIEVAGPPRERIELQVWMNGAKVGSPTTGKIDDDGRWIGPVWVPTFSGTYAVEVNSVSGQIGVSAITPLAKRGASITLGPPAVIRGRVAGARSSRLVAIVERGGWRRAAEWSDSDGGFIVAGVPSGACTLVTYQRRCGCSSGAMVVSRYARRSTRDVKAIAGGVIVVDEPR